MAPTTSDTTTASQPEAGGLRQSRVYQAIMTPINFISFLLSLYLIDCHYENKRTHAYAPQTTTAAAAGGAAGGGKGGDSQLHLRLPSWLHRVLFRPQPYQWVDRRPAPPNRNEERWYYHTDKRKIMKMEAADAFELRNAVLLGMCVAGLGLAWMSWCAGRRAWGWYGEGF